MVNACIYVILIVKKGLIRTEAGAINLNFTQSVIHKWNRSLGRMIEAKFKKQLESLIGWAGILGRLDQMSRRTSLPKLLIM